jgi:DNA-binding IclR family transcriptional regulator
MTLAQTPHSSDSLRRRARSAMERLRTQTGETVYLAVPHAGHFVVIEALESPHILRMVPAIGMLIHVKDSATSRAVFAHMTPEAISEFFGADHAALSEQEREHTLTHGYAINDGDIVPGSVTMASAIIGDEPMPLGAIVVTGPADRFPPDRREDLGRKLYECALSLSTGKVTDAEAVPASYL